MIPDAVFVLRPEPGLGATLAAARALGLEAIAAPLFAVQPVGWTVPDGRFDALLVGSANVFRHGGADLQRLMHLPVHAVGKATAEAARARGFAVAQTGRGGLQRVLETMAGPLRLLRLRGEVHVPLAPPEGIAIIEVAVYRTVPLALSIEAAGRLSNTGGVVLLHSGEAAARFTGECDRLGIDRGRIALAALAPRIAQNAGAGWRDVRIAREMAGGELLELAKEMCQKP